MPTKFTNSTSYSYEDFYQMTLNIYNKTKDGYANISEIDLVGIQPCRRNKVKGFNIVSFLISEAVLSYRKEGSKRFYMWIGDTNLADIARRYFDYHYVSKHR